MHHMHTCIHVRTYIQHTHQDPTPRPCRFSLGRAFLPALSCVCEGEGESVSPSRACMLAIRPFPRSTLLDRAFLTVCIATSSSRPPDTPRHSLLPPSLPPLARLARLASPPASPASPVSSGLLLTPFPEPLNPPCPPVRGIPRSRSRTHRRGQAGRRAHLPVCPPPLSSSPPHPPHLPS